MSFLDVSEKPLKQLLWQIKRRSHSKDVLLEELDLKDFLRNNHESKHKDQILGFFCAGVLSGILFSLATGLN